MCKVVMISPPNAHDMLHTGPGMLYVGGPAMLIELRPRRSQRAELSLLQPGES